MRNNNYRNSEGYSDPTFGAAMSSIARKERQVRRNNRRAGREYKTPATKTKTKPQKKAPAAVKQEFHGYRPVVYICSPYAGDTVRNILAAQKYCRYAALTGYIPFAAHLIFPQFLDDGKADERALGLSFGNVFMDRCKEVWIFGDTLSSGMRAERDRAMSRHMTIRYFTTDCIEVQRDGTGGGDGSL